MGMSRQIESNISILHANVVTLTFDLSSNASRTSVLESNIYYTYEDSFDEDDDPVVLLGNVSTLHTIVESLETDPTSNTERIAAIEGDYVTNADLAIATAFTGAGAGFLTAAFVWYTRASGSTRTVGGFFDELVVVEDESPEFTLNDVVQKPEDWSSYLPLLLGNTTLKSYIEQKSAIQGAAKAQLEVDNLVNRYREESSFMKLRDHYINANLIRGNTTKIDFLRSTPEEEYGDYLGADWRITTNQSYGMDFHRKSTDPNLGTSLYNGNVLELKEDGDVNVVKAGGLKINNDEVATQNFVTGTSQTILIQLFLSWSHHHQIIISVLQQSRVLDM
jgi:hypothetical protein